MQIACFIAGHGIALHTSEDGIISLTATTSGLLCIDVDFLNLLNSMGNICLGTIHRHQYVNSGRILGKLRVMSSVSGEHLAEMERMCAAHGPVMEVQTLRAAQVGIVTTGSEIYYGRQKDGFGKLLHSKFSALGSSVAGEIVVTDQVDMIVHAIVSLVGQGADLIAVTGGMSVDADDRTPAAIRQTGARVIAYGAPTYPGAMFLLAYLGEIPVLGLPSGMIRRKSSILDLLLPRILAGKKLERRDIAALGHGGFCENCSPCAFPVCGFGKD